MTKSRHDTTIRTEARVGIVGSLKSSMDRLAFIQSQMGIVSLQVTTKQIEEVRADIERLIKNLNDPSDPPYVAAELCKLVRELLPVKPIHDPKKPPPSDRMIAAYHRARLELINELNKDAKSTGKVEKS